MPTLPYLRRFLVNRPDVADNPGVFPYLPGQLFAQLKTPSWVTKIDQAVSGVERRRAMWSYPVWKFQVAYEFIRDTKNHPEIEKLWAFFNSQAGSFNSWNYFDPWDHTATSQMFGQGDGTTVTFQLTRTMTSGGISFTEPVRSLIGLPQVQVGGVATTAYAISPGGNITFTTAPAAGMSLTWTGEFYFLCRFAIDELNTQQIFEKFWSGDTINFQTFKS